MHQRAFLGGGWARGGSSEVVRRAHPASGAQWNVQVVRGKVNGKCLWNACKALSLGLLLMVLGAAMATIGYFADHLSSAQEVRGNYTVRVKNESRGFHLNNLSYAGPIVMGVGGFIVVAACVMTFEARDSAAKVVPARLKMSTNAPVSNICRHPVHSAHNSLRTSGSQTGSSIHAHPHQYCSRNSDRRVVTQNFLQFSRGLVLDQHNKSLLKSQGSINKSPSAPDLVTELLKNKDQSPTAGHNFPNKTTAKTSRRTFAACALLNPGLLHRHALSVDEASGNYRMSRESLHNAGSQGSMAMDLHLEYPVTLKIRDRRKPLRRQRKVEEEEKQQTGEDSRRSSHSCSARTISQYLKETPTTGGGSAHQLPTNPSNFTPSPNRRSSNASDCTHRFRPRRRDLPHHHGRLERAVSTESRFAGPRCHHSATTSTQNSTEQEPPAFSSDSDIRRSHHAMVHFSLPRD